MACATCALTDDGRAGRLASAFLVFAALLVGCSPALDWREVRVEGRDAFVLLPCKPAAHARQVRLAEGDVERHPEIQALRRYREALDAGLLVFDAAAAEALEATRSRLAALGDDPSLGQEERAWYAKVARRYLELMPTLE